MFSLFPYPLCPETQLALMDRNSAVCAQHAPRENYLLAALPLADYERLLPDLESVPLPPGRIIHHAGDGQKYLYFITSGIVSRCYVTQDGASVESAVTGNEGVIGVSSFLGGDSTPSQALVVSAGHAYRLGVGVMKGEFKQGSPLPYLLLRYTLALIRQIGQTAACIRHHSLRQQLCRFVLSRLDRLCSNELAMTHELIANMLGVRREGVTEAAGQLQEERLIRYGRGHITVLDRRALEKHACECYALLKSEFEHLSPYRIEHLPRPAGQHVQSDLRGNALWDPPESRDLGQRYRAGSLRRQAGTGVNADFLRGIRISG